MKFLLLQGTVVFDILFIFFFCCLQTAYSSGGAEGNWLLGKQNTADLTAIFINNKQPFMC